MSNYYGFYSSLPYTPTVPPPTSAPHYYNPQPIAYPLMHRQIPTTIPNQPIITLATVTTTKPYYHPVPPTLTSYLPPTPPTPSTTHPSLPQLPTVAPPLLTPTHQDAWAAKRAAQHSELMHLLHLRLGIPEPQPPPPPPILSPTPSSQTLMSPPPPSPTLPTPPSSPVASKPLLPLAATATITLSPTSRSAPTSKPPPLPGTVHPPPSFPRPVTMTPSAPSLVAFNLLFEESGFLIPTTNRPPPFSGPYDTQLFEKGPSGYRIWNPGGQHAHVD